MEDFWIFPNKEAFMDIVEDDEDTTFLATLVALHFTPVSRSLGQSQFLTSVALRLESLFF